MNLCGKERLDTAEKVAFEKLKEFHNAIADIYAALGDIGIEINQSSVPADD